MKKQNKFCDYVYTVHLFFQGVEYPLEVPPRDGEEVYCPAAPALLRSQLHAEIIQLLVKIINTI